MNTSAQFAAVVVVSLLPELARTGAPWREVEQRWHGIAASLGQCAAPVKLLCTIFRHVGNLPADARPAAIERIRRLNLLAARLSHSTGIGVADIDRTFAHLGARTIATDHGLGGAAAAELAAHVIVSAILAGNLDAALPEGTEERARQIHRTTMQQTMARIQHRAAAAMRTVQ